MTEEVINQGAGDELSDAMKNLKVDDDESNSTEKFEKISKFYPKISIFQKFSTFFFSFPEFLHNSTTTN